MPCLNPTRTARSSAVHLGEDLKHRRGSLSLLLQAPIRGLRINQPGHHGGHPTVTLLKENVTMFDLTPLYRSTVGFDRLARTLNEASAFDAPTYPPYNIEKLNSVGICQIECGAQVRSTG